MEHSDIVPCDDVRDLIDQYVNVALTSRHVVEISPMPLEMSCLAVFPLGHTRKKANFIRDFRAAISEQPAHHHRDRLNLRNCHEMPCLTYHPDSTQLVCRVGHGSALVEVLPRDLAAIINYMKEMEMFFDLPTASEPKATGRKKPKTVVPFYGVRKKVTRGLFHE